MAGIGAIDDQLTRREIDEPSAVVAAVAEIDRRFPVKR